MRLILFTWEFPPRIVGQLAHYVNRLAAELVKKTVEVHIVTYHDSWTGFHQGADGIKAYRIANPVSPQINILTWLLSLNQEFERISADIYYSNQHRVDLVDVHDWHFVPAAVTLKKALRLPFAFSVDSIENHRSHGSNVPLSLSISGLESLGVHEASLIVAKSEWMRQEIYRNYKPMPEKVITIPPDSSSWISDTIDAYDNVAKAILN